jgi:hypothetical protein
MTAIRSFPNAPLAQRRGRKLNAHLPGLAVKAWMALHRYGQLRAARELELLGDRHARGEPALARQLREAAAECRHNSRNLPTDVEGSRS